MQEDCETGFQAIFKRADTGGIRAPAGWTSSLDGRRRRRCGRRRTGVVTLLADVQTLLAAVLIIPES